MTREEDTVTPAPWTPYAVQTGRGRIDAFDPVPEAIHIEDIAQGLASRGRWSGWTARYYSVAQHCLAVSALLVTRGAQPEVALAGLLHDASEAYFSDIPTPHKRHPAYARVLEADAHLQRAIYLRYDLSPEAGVAVDQADNDMLHAEAVLLMRSPSWCRPEKYDGMPDAVRRVMLAPLAPDHATKAYLGAYWKLQAQRGGRVANDDE